MMTFEEWWDECMSWIEYEPDQYKKWMARAAWEVAWDEQQRVIDEMHLAFRGHVLVPVKPTEAMERAVLALSTDWNGAVNPFDAYEAMIQAAQEEE